MKTKKEQEKEQKKEQKPDTKNLVARNGIWQINAMVKGVMIRQSLHTDDLSVARTKRDAILLPLKATRDEKQMLTSVRRQMEGISAEEERKRQSAEKGVTIADAFKVFRKDPTRKACKEQQFKNHESNWGKFVKWLHRKHPQIIYCRQVTKSICVKWAGELLESVRATNTYNHYISSVRYVFSSVCARDDGFRNPMETIHKRPDDDAVGKEPFTDKELRIIFASSDDEFVRLCAIGLYTTLRLGSARKLRWDMLDERLEYIQATHDKTGADASQRIAAELREILERVPAEARVGFICPTYAEKLKTNAAALVQQKLNDLGIQTHREMPGLNKTVRRACIKGFHSFRHTAITRALQNGATTSQVKRLAGHTSERMQERYTHLSADDAGKANALIGKFW